MVRVSVEVLTYNHSNYIRQCLDSVIMQKTKFEFEILVYDDASTDGNQDIIQEYLDRYPDLVKDFRQRDNQFSKGKLKEAILNMMQKHAKGKYVALCEGDDYWTDPNKLQKQYDFMEGHSDYSVCMHRARVIGDDGKAVGKFLGPRGIDRDVTFEDDLLRFYATASKFFRREYYENIPSFYYIGPAEDYPMMIILLVNGKGYYMKDEMCIYRRNVPGSASTVLRKQSHDTRIKYQNERIILLKEAQEYYKPKYYKEFDRYLALQENAKIIEYDSFRDKLKFYFSMTKQDYYKRQTFRTKCKILFRSFCLKPYTIVARLLKKV